ncbi:MAG: type II toxin-antitoxin system VapC family toxin [Dehalococcoidia bacterium]
MPEVILDASALLALLNAEPGADVVAESIPGAMINAVNLSEVVGKLCTAGMPEKAIRQALQGLDLKVIPFDEEHSYGAGLMRATTERMGLSLGDRACLDTARRLGLPALTTDKMWGELSVGAIVRIIR